MLAMSVWRRVCLRWQGLDHKGSLLNDFYLGLTTVMRWEGISTVAYICDMVLIMCDIFSFVSDRPQQYLPDECSIFT